MRELRGAGKALCFQSDACCLHELHLPFSGQIVPKITPGIDLQRWCICVQIKAQPGLWVEKSCRKSQPV